MIVLGAKGEFCVFFKTKLMIVLGAKVGGESWVRKLSAEVGAKKKKSHLRRNSRKTCKTRKKVVFLPVRVHRGCRVQSVKGDP
jgi:hypothetical protein